MAESPIYLSQDYRKSSSAGTEKNDDSKQSVKIRHLRVGCACGKIFETVFASNAPLLIHQLD